MQLNPGLIDMIMALRGRGVSDNALLRAMELVDRRKYVPQDFSAQAYDELALPIACGQSIASPLTTAFMCQVAGVSKDHKLLEIGSGSGYQSAVLAKMAARVYAVERYKTLVKEAEVRFKTHNIVNIVMRHGDGRFGWKGQAPFDRIILGCAVKAVPKAVMAQLAAGGRLVAVTKGELTVFDKKRSKISKRVIMPLTLDMLETGKSHSL